MKKFLGILVLGLLFIFVSNIPEAKAEDFKLTKITENLKSPWSLSFINQNEALITEKSGNIIYINIEKQELNQQKTTRNRNQKSAENQKNTGNKNKNRNQNRNRNQKSTSNNKEKSTEKVI